MAGSTTRAEDSPQANGHSPKRKAEDIGSSGTHTRTKRNRYISIACSECKRRKIKCNGQIPCQRCGNLSLECLYAPNCCTTSVKDSEEFQQMKAHIGSLQHQVDTLVTNLHSLRDRQDAFSSSTEPVYSQDGRRSTSISVSRNLPPLISPSRPHKSLPQFHGPTSSTYGFDVAKSTLQNMGIAPESGTDDGQTTADGTPTASPMNPVTFHPSKDPIWTIDQKEAIRLCHVYEEEIGIMYPLVDIKKIIEHTRMLYMFIGAAMRTGFGAVDLPGADAIEDDDTNILKMILAITLVLEGSGQSDLGHRIFETLKPTISAKIVGPTDMNGLILLVLAATYHFHDDQESRAWRLIGIAARLCVEMGLHRKDFLVKTFTNEAEYLDGLRVFWVVYALDRRWSFGTGMPFAMQDSDIDSSLPEPGDSNIYLREITKYNHIASRVWYYNLAYESGSETKGDQIGFLDYQVLQWYQQLPESLKFNSKDLGSETKVQSRGLRRLRFLMFLRANQARISIYRPILLSATSIMDNRRCAQVVVDVARATISTITRVNQTSDIYRTQQVCYNYFLVQALAVIFLAVSHAPAEFCQQTREEFYAAIDLIRGFSTRSHIAKRLWRTVRGLKELGEKIGLVGRGANDPESDAHSNAAVAMAGLAGHPVDDLAFYGTTLRINVNDLALSPLDGQQIGTELTNLFELAGGYGNGALNATAGSDGYSGFIGASGEIHSGGDGVNALFGNEQEFSRIMGELF